ncbi:hypothetical protein F4808DRAFT_2383 [Astrocystis sublimbata]|nr:hypothetical protein F4808DRAFT_2383 [Astrocystis sublimbata]
MHINLSHTFGQTARKRRRDRQPLVASKPNKVARRTQASFQPSPRHLAMQRQCHCAREELSVFNQCSPRGYICVVLCFPCDDNLRGDAVHHIRQSLARLAKTRPIFAGRLQTDNGRVYLQRSCSFDIPFEVVPTEAEDELDYEQLRRNEFPPATFIDTRYGIPGLTSPNCNPIPVSKVDVTFARGGLFLSIFLQHSITDGGSLSVFLEAFGNQTRNVPDYLPSEQRLRILNPNGRLHCAAASRKLSEMSPFNRLVKSCPEYTILSDLSGPTQPRMQSAGRPIADLKKTGKIFVFMAERLEELRKLVSNTGYLDELPTAYTSLAALTFAHVTKARTKTEPAQTGIEPSQAASLWNSVNWRTRALPGATDNYFGNAVLPAVTRVTREKVNAAAYDDQGLAGLVPLIRDSIAEVDDEYVRRRMSMMSQAPDPRMVGVNYDPRSPDVLAFNTWRHFGADMEWNIPGVPVSKPDTIRRATGGFGLGTALILPARKDAGKQELFVSLTVEAMEALCGDERWMEWVDRVIG